MAVQFVGEDEVYPIQCGELLAMDDEMPFGDYCELYLGMLVLAPYIQQDGTVAHHPAKLTSLDAKGITVIVSFYLYLPTSAVTMYVSVCNSMSTFEHRM